MSVRWNEAWTISFKIRVKVESRDAFGWKWFIYKNHTYIFYDKGFSTDSRHYCQNFYIISLPSRFTIFPPTKPYLALVHPAKPQSQIKRPFLRLKRDSKIEKSTRQLISIVKSVTKARLNLPVERWQQRDRSQVDQWCIFATVLCSANANVTLRSWSMTHG